MIETMDIVKYSFFAGCSILAFYKLIVSIIHFDKEDLFAFGKQKRTFRSGRAIPNYFVYEVLSICIADDFTWLFYCSPNRFLKLK